MTDNRTDAKLLPYILAALAAFSDQWVLWPALHGPREITIRAGAVKAGWLAAEQGRDQEGAWLATWDWVCRPLRCEVGASMAAHRIRAAQLLPVVIAGEVAR